MPRLRRWKKRKCSLFILRAGLKYVAPTALERGRAGTARRKGGGQDIPLVPEIFDAVPLRKAERGKRQGAGLKPGPYKPSGRSLPAARSFKARRRPSSSAGVRRPWR